MTPTPPRGPDEILGELGRRLDRAYRDAPRHGRLGMRLPVAPRPPRTHRARWVVAAVAAVALAGPTAVATRDAIFAPAPPPAPPQARGGAGAVQPDAVGAPVNVARGTRHAIAWQMSASLCRYGSVQAVGLFLDVPGGGAGARCDVASRTPGAAPPPVALGERRTQTYIDPVSGRTWVFGVLPAAATTAVVSSRALDAPATAPPTALHTVAMPIDARAADHGIPAGLRVFVAAASGARQVIRVEALDASGAVVLRCRRDGRCRVPATASSSYEESRP